MRTGCRLSEGGYTLTSGAIVVKAIRLRFHQVSFAYCCAIYHDGNGVATSTDQLFKELLHEFFPEFMALVYPDVAARLDFRKVDFLDTEAFSELSTKTRRTADLVARVPSRQSGAPEIILIHVEVQAVRRPEFPRRMFEYYMLFNLRHRIPIYPIALYLAGGAGGLTNETYVERLFDEEFLRFHYKAIGLPDLAADDYLTRPNPLGPTLSSLMRFRRGMSFAERKTAILRQRAIMETNEARRVLLLNVIDNCIKLNDVQQAEFDRLINASGLGEVRQMITSYEQRGREIDLQEGMQQGMQRITLKILEARFGAPSLAVRARIGAITDPAALERLVEQIEAATSLDEVNQYLD